MLNLKELLEGAQYVGIAGHVRPDGDCVGSTMGLYTFLKEQYPQIRTEVRLESIPDAFRFIKGTEEVITLEVEEESPNDMLGMILAEQRRKMQGETKKEETVPVYDVFFCLDCGDLQRLGSNAPCFEQAKKTVCIDHHISNTSFADVNWVDPKASSTSELICDLCGVENISFDAAEALYTGMAHDTGVFQYSCTSSHTMALAGALMDKGIDFSDIVSKSYFEKTYVQNQILGKALLESMELLHGKVIFSVLTLRDMKLFEAKGSDLEGIVAQLRNTKGCECAIFLHEEEPNQYKVSLRSNGKVNVADIAVHFGGGGHARAAGCTMMGSYRDVINNLMPLVESQLKANS